MSSPRSQLGPRTSCPLRAVKARSAGSTVNAGRFQIEPSEELSIRTNPAERA
jgi:hypothetical protein